MIAVLVLAAGAGRRFGGVKQLAPFGGEPLVERVVRQAGDARGPGEVVVVLGSHADEVLTGASLGRARVVICKDWEQGQAASLRCGISALEHAKAVLVLLADQPFVGAAALERVLAARSPGSVAVRATYGGTPGHPVLFERRLFPELLRLTGDIGARELLARSAVVEVPCDDIAAPDDVDSPADLEALQARQSQRG